MVESKIELQIYLGLAWFWVGNQLTTTISYETFEETDKAYVFDTTAIWKDTRNLVVKDCREQQRQERAIKANINKVDGN